MQKRVFSLLGSVLLYSGAALAGPVFSLDPADGQLTASPGATVGWGFVVNPDAVNWISFTGSALQNLSLPLVGDYVDFIGSMGGPMNAVLAAGAMPWVQSFDAGLGTGTGAFTVDPGAAPGSFETGEIVVFYDQFSDDPNTCGSCYQGPGSFTAPFRIDVAAAAAVPEPATGGLFAIALLGALLRRARVNRIS